MAQVWNVPGARRPGFGPRLLRSVLVLAVLALAIVGTAALTTVATLRARRASRHRSSRRCCVVVAQRRALLARVPRADARARSRPATSCPARSSAASRGPRCRRLGALLGGSPAAAHQRALRHLRRGARPALLPLPRGADHRVRRRDQRRAGAPSRPALARAAAAHRGRRAVLADVAETEQRRPEQDVST